MSGGFFDYRQFQIRNIWEELQTLLDRQGREKKQNELYLGEKFYEEFPEEKFFPTFPEGVQEIMKDAIKYLKIAEIYTQRIDWYLSGDDGEEALYNRLEEDLEKINNLYYGKTNL